MRPVAAMLRRYPLLAFALLWTALSASPSPGATLPGWCENWNTAREMADKAKRPLVVVFVQAQCPECLRMDRVLCTRAARGALRNAVKARLEFGDFPQLASRFAVTATPTLLLFTPDNGYQDSLYRQEGALSSSQIQSLGKSVDMLVAQSCRQESSAPTPSPTPQPPSARRGAASRPSKSAKQTPARDDQRQARSLEEYGYYVYQEPHTPK